jgi:hypothetical protein
MADRVGSDRIAASLPSSRVTASIRSEGFFRAIISRGAFPPGGDEDSRYGLHPVGLAVDEALALVGINGRTNDVDGGYVLHWSAERQGVE